MEADGKGPKSLKYTSSRTYTIHRTLSTLIDTSRSLFATYIPLDYLFDKGNSKYSQFVPLSVSCRNNRRRLHL
jgi:hypothetical protein